jgi:crossover junction endodeoxyribonuclease RusA
MTLAIDLPWPDKAAWPNGGHGHWAVNHRAKKAARVAARWSTRIAMGRTYGPSCTKLDHDGQSKVGIKIIASPKTANAVDEQNLIAGLKGDLDGIADGIGIDDKFFNLRGVEWREPVNGGAVTIEVTL